jgi:hypothetical protein
MPNVIRIYVTLPKEPFISVGDNSLIKLGTNTEKAPAAIPKKNLPARIQYSFYIRVRAHPMLTIILVP